MLPRFLSSRVLQSSWTTWRPLNLAKVSAFAPAGACFPRVPVVQSRLFWPDLETRETLEIKYKPRTAPRNEMARLGVETDSLLGFKKGIMTRIDDADRRSDIF